MKNTAKRILAAFLCLALLAGVPISLAVSADNTAEREAARADLIAAWNGLVKEVTEEISSFQGTYNTSDFAQNTSITLTDDQLAKMGSKYAMVGAAEGCSNAWDNTTIASVDFTKYKSLSLSAYGVSNGQYQIKMRDKNYNWKNAHVWVDAGEFKTSSVDMGLLDGSYVPVEIQILKHDQASATQHKGPYYVGALMGVKEVKAEVPADAATMNFAELVLTAKAVDLTGFDATAFNTALAAAEALVTEDELDVAELVMAWNSLSKKVTETLIEAPATLQMSTSAPTARQEVTESTNADGLDASLLGPYWLEKVPFTSCGWAYTPIFNSTKGFKLADYDSVEWYVRFYKADGTNASVKLLTQLNSSQQMYTDPVNGWTKIKFNTADVTIKNVKFIPETLLSGPVASMSIGCAMGTRTLTYEAPENAYTMDLAELVLTAKKLDTAGCATAAAFNAALATLEAKVDEEELLATDLILEWNKLSKLSVETIAIPPAALNPVAVTDSTVVEGNGLSDKGLLGSHYASKAAHTGVSGNNIWIMYQLQIEDLNLSEWEEVYTYFHLWNGDAKASANMVTQVNSVGDYSNWGDSQYTTGWQKVAFKRVDAEVNSLKIGVNNYSATTTTHTAISLGSVVGKRIVKLSAPENAKEMKLRKLVRAAEEVDLTGFDSAAFELALAKAQAYAFPSEEKVRADLIAAWNAMTKKVTEVVAVPPTSITDKAGTPVARKETAVTAPVAGPSDVAGLGTYYYEKLDWRNSDTITYTLTQSPVDLTQYESLYLWIASYNEAGAATNNKFHHQFNNSDSYGGYAEFTGWSKRALNKTHTAATSFKFNVQENTYKYLSFGSVMGERMIQLSAPANAETMAMADLVELARAVDLEGYADDLRAAFEKALVQAMLFVGEDDPEMELSLDLIAAWQMLKAKESTVLAYVDAATPVSNLSDSLGLTDAQKALLGTKVLNNVSGQKTSYSALAKGKDLSSYDSFSVAIYVASGSSQVTVGVERGSWSWGLNWATCQTGFTNKEITRESATGLWKDLLDGTKTINGYSTEIHSNAANTYVGSLLGWKTVAAKLPGNVYALSIDELYEAAAEVDLLAHTGDTETFSAMLTKVDDYLVSLDAEKTAAKNLIAEWNKLSKRVVETVAIPGNHGDQFAQVTPQEVTAQTAPSDIDDISKLGTHWVKESTVNATAGEDPKTYWFVTKVEDMTLYDTLYFYSVGYDENGATIAHKYMEQIGTTNYPQMWSNNGWYKFDVGTTTTHAAHYKIVVYKSDYNDKTPTTISFGSLIGERTVTAKAPNNAKQLTLKELVEAAREFRTADGDGYDLTAFNAALATAEALVLAVDPEEKAREDLIAAWEKLATETKKGTFIIADPAETYAEKATWGPATRKEVTAVPAGFTGELKELGDYWIEKMPYTSFGWNEIMFVFREKPVDLSKFDSVFFWVAGYDADGNFVSLQAQNQVNGDGGSTAWPNTDRAWGKASVVRTSTEAKAANSVKFMPSRITGNTDEIAYISFGSVVAVGDYTPALPEGYASMSLDNLVEAAKKVDADGFENKDAFTAALAAAEQYADASKELRENLMKEWEALKATYTDLVAIPKAQYTGTDGQIYERTEITGSTVVEGLSKPSVLGPYYVNKLAMNHAGWTNPVYTGYQLLETNLAKYNDGVYYYAAAYGEDGQPIKVKFNAQLNSSVSAWLDTKGWGKGPVSRTVGSSLQLVVESLLETNAETGEPIPVAYISFGSVYGTYTNRAEIPENAAELSFVDLVAAAEACDVSEFTSANTDAGSVVDSAKFKAVLAECRALIENSKQAVYDEWDALGLTRDPSVETLNEEALIEAARNLDLSSTPKFTIDFAHAVWTLGKLTETGEALEALRAAWAAVADLPQNYRLLPVDKWVEKAADVDLSAASDEQKTAFNEALALVADLLTKGKADIDALKALVTKGQTMKSYDFTEATWSAFEEALAKAAAVLDSYAKVTQKKVDAAAEALNTAWGTLEYYKERTLWLDFKEFHTGINPQASHNSEGSTDTVYSAVNVELPSGMKTALSIQTQPCGWYPVNHGGIRLDLLQGYDSMEIWFKADKETFPGSKLVMQLMTDGGGSWYNLYYTLPENATSGEWVRLEIPLSRFGKRQTASGAQEYTIDIDNTPIARMRLMTEGLGGQKCSYMVSSIALVKTGTVTAGEVPNAARVVMTVRKEEEVKPPKNPFTGVDRGDPWGEEERENNKKPVVEEDKKPETITKVAGGKCGENLTWVLNSDGELIISGTGAMDDYTDAAPWSEYADDILSVTVKDGVTSVGDNAFYACSSLQKVDLPQTLTSIGAYAFYECPLLTFIVVPDAVDTIGDYALGYVYSEEIGDAIAVEGYGIYGTAGSAANEYADIYGLDFYAIAPNPNGSDSDNSGNEGFGEQEPVAQVLDSGACGTSVQWTFYDDGTLVISGTGAMDDYEDVAPWEAYLAQITSVVIEEGVTSIGNSAFYGYSALTSVSIADTVTRIGEYAFYECPALLELTVPASVTEIGAYAIGFVYDAAIENVKAVEGFVLYGASASAADTYAKENGLTFGKEVAQGTCGQDLTWVFYSTGKLVISGTGDMDNFEDVTPWEEHLYDILSVEIEEGVTGIGDSAFYGCRNLKAVSIPKSVARIGSFAFYECYALTSVKLGNAVTNVGPYAFGYVYDETIDNVKVLDGFKLFVTDPSAGLIYAQTYEVPYEVYEEEVGDNIQTEPQPADGLAWWIWLLIGLGGVAVLGGGTVLVLVLLKKKKNTAKTEVAE